MAKNKYRADQIGSLLRPPAVLEARDAFAEGRIGADELRAIEDDAIREVVKLQEDVGIDVVTDGEFRRTDFRTGFSDAFEGFTTGRRPMIWHGPEGDVTIEVTSIVVDAPLAQTRRVTQGEVPFLLEITDKPVKSTQIAPGFIQDRSWEDGVTDQAYFSREEFADVCAEITRGEIKALIAEGCKYIQLDNPGYSAYVDAPTRERMAADGIDPDESFRRMLETDIAALQGIDAPDDVTLGLHVCRGNNKSLWLAEGSYEPIAEELFSELPVDRLLVEYSDERSGGFEPLRFVPDDKIVVLGLESSKSPDLETADELRARIEQASKFIDIDRLALSPQCGFSTIAKGGNALTVEDQKAKLGRVVEVARSIWND